MKYKIATGAHLTQAIHDLSLNQSSLARIMQSLGDRREQDIIARNLRNMVSGRTRVNDEIIVILNMLASLKEAGLMPDDPKNKNG